MRVPLAVAAALLCLPLLGTPPAHAAVLQPAGPLCDYEAWEGEAGSWTAVFRAGPLRVVDEDDPSVVQTATVTCALNHAGDATYTATPWLSVTSDPATGAAVLPPTAVHYDGEWPYEYRLCTRVDVDGRALYWNAPDDRDVDGWWSTSPSATCDKSWETLDLRAEDQPMRTVLSAAGTAFGETDPAVAVAEPQVCALPRDVVDQVWACGAPSTWTTMSFARVPGVGAVVRGLPYGWACTDARTGTPVSRGSLLATPDPGISCLPPPAYPVHCQWMQVSGYLAPATLGRVTVTSACGDVSVSRPLTPIEGDVVAQWSGDYGWGTLPWRCVADEDTRPVDPAYVQLCNLLGG